MIRSILRMGLVLPVLALCVPGTAAAFQTVSPQALYQEALVAEQAVGDLATAIDLYERVARMSGNNRSLAAQALVRAAGAYEKLESTQAGALYAEVLRRYPEQTEWVSVAEARLGALQLGAPPAGSRRTDVSATLDPILSAYCVTCHNASTRTAGLALSELNTADVSEEPALWENVLGRLRSGTMPPADTARPDAGTRRRVVTTLELALDQAYPSQGMRQRVSDPDLASRLSGLIWAAPPDAELIDAARQGRLRDPRVLEQQVRRMLGDPRSVALVEGFFEQWLSPIGNLDAERYAAVDPALRQAFRQETRLFIGSQLREDRPAMELWTADYSFLNDRLAEHYGIAGVDGARFRRVDLPSATRGGLLGHGSFLLTTAPVTRTSPTSRGRAILMNFFGERAPDPPPGVAPMPEVERPGRSRLADHLVNPGCAGCHRIFDPLGLALENFDATGRWRTTDQGAPIDASGAFVDGTAYLGPEQFRAALTGYKDAFMTHAAKSLLAYALGRDMPRGEPYPYEMPTVRAIVRESAAADYRWASLLLGVVRSDLFQTEEIIP